MQTRSSPASPGQEHHETKQECSSPRARSPLPADNWTCFPQWWMCPFRNLSCGTQRRPTTRGKRNECTHATINHSRTWPHKSSPNARDTAIHMNYVAESTLTASDTLTTSAKQPQHRQRQHKIEKPSPRTLGTCAYPQKYNAPGKRYGRPTR